jgi:drug/metabolite transporter (DMT)-like permease
MVVDVGAAGVSPTAASLFALLNAELLLFSRTNLPQASLVAPSSDASGTTITSMFGIVLYFLFENNALQYTTASNASMLVAAMPLFAIIIEAFFFRQRISWKMAVCILISIVGVYLVVTVDGRLDFSSSRFYGNLLMMGSMICWVVYTFLNKNLDGKYSGMAVITYQSLASIFLFMPFVLPEVKRWPEFGSISLSSWQIWYSWEWSALPWNTFSIFMRSRS